MGVRSWKLYAHVTLPWLIFLIVLLLAMWNNVQDTGEKPEQKPLVVLVDKVFRLRGPLIPFGLLLIQLFIFPFSQLIEDKLIKAEPESRLNAFTGVVPWTKRMCALFVLIFVLRLLLYQPMKIVHYFASDHVFLATSMIAQIHMVMAVAGHAFYSKDAHHFKAGFLLCLSWLLLISMYYELWFTAKYYHTPTADIVGFLCGLIVFGGIALGWTKEIDRGIDVNVNSEYANLP